MTTYLVTGASGHLGRLAVHALLERGVAASDVVATARDTDAISDLAALGVETRTADYTDPASLEQALKGVDRVLLVSSSAVGERVAQHTHVIEAAAKAGVELLAYTSITRADTSTLALADEHRATEEVLAASGLPVVLLRNSWYLENYTGQVATALEHGAVLGAAGEGRVSAASRADYAAAAAAALVADDQAGRVHELGGDVAFTLEEYAAALAAESGTEVVYRDLPAADYTAVLVGAGLPEPYAAILADSDLGLARGELHTDSGDLSRLTGRPTTSLTDAVRAALA
ncbi:NAD-dependent epimerase/dehydratase family protein [Nocardioides oleivorans]|uniref:NAD-dependent epimerase/dehydratase family protein n=1 Tax=Nocardioides oleivorans TaxID=273676 RepID=A0A4Q2S0Z1_9ACTN|nr:NAD(P)H-binding protein [Nocardioides oleivorans]RYB95187.1 NAD-dependent epimerase/dehydratase family protein [Nocardioides oleivorans]